MAIFSSDIKGSPRSGIQRTGIRAVRCVTKPKWDYVKIECSFSHRDNLMGTYQLCLLGGRIGAHTPSLSPLVFLSILWWWWTISRFSETVSCIQWTQLRHTINLLFMFQLWGWIYADSLSVWLSDCSEGAHSSDWLTDWIIARDCSRRSWRGLVSFLHTEKDWTKDTAWLSGCGSRELPNDDFPAFAILNWIVWFVVRLSLRRVKVVTWKLKTLNLFNTSIAMVEITYTSYHASK